jgi:hypothetical protein
VWFHSRTYPEGSETRVSLGFAGVDDSQLCCGHRRRDLH